MDAHLLKMWLALNSNRQDKPQDQLQQTLQKSGGLLANQATFGMPSKSEYTCHYHYIIENWLVQKRIDTTNFMKFFSNFALFALQPVSAHFRGFDSGFRFFPNL